MDKSLSMRSLGKVLEEEEDTVAVDDDDDDDDDDEDDDDDDSSDSEESDEDNCDTKPVKFRNRWTAAFMKFYASKPLKHDCCQFFIFMTASPEV